MSEYKVLEEKLKRSETNDCVVRAISEAFDVSYTQAWWFCSKKLKRVPRQGTYTGIYLPKIQQAFGKKIKQLGRKLKEGYNYKKLYQECNTKVVKTVCKEYLDEEGKLRWKYIDKKYKRKEKRPLKVKDFLKNYPKGSYIVTVRKHAFSVVDGVIGGNWEDNKRLTREVLSAFQIG